MTKVLLGIVSFDPESYLDLDPEWTPTLRSRGERFGLRDILVPISD